MEKGVLKETLARNSRHKADKREFVSILRRMSKPMTRPRVSIKNEVDWTTDEA